MSNFNCEHCGAVHIDSRRGYTTRCEHYPRDYERRSTAAREEAISFLSLYNDFSINEEYSE